MLKTSLTSKRKPSEKQIRRVRTLTTEALDVVLEKEGAFMFTADQFQAVHANGGLFKQEFAISYRAFVFAFARKALGIVTPIRAQETGLVPAGWSVQSDSLEGGINLADLDYSFCLYQDGEIRVDGDTMIERSVGACGSLGFVAALLKLQREGKDIFPYESRCVDRFVMPRTILFDGNRRMVSCLCWGGSHWFHYYEPMDNNFASYNLIRPRQQ